MTSPIRGFKQLFPALVRERPGLTSEEYARWALEEGRASSNSKNPAWSLQTTADKEYREGRMPGVKKINGRYYPADYPVNGESQPRKETRMVIMLPEDALKDVHLLVEGSSRGQSEAVVWLIEEGRKARRSDLDDLRKAFEEIERLKKSAGELI